MAKIKAQILRDEEGTPTVITLQKGGRKCEIRYDSTIGFQVEGTLTPEFASILAASAIFGKTQVSGDVSSDVDLVKVDGVAIAAPTVAACVPASIENPALAYDGVNDRFKVDVKATVGALEAGGNLATIAAKDFATQTTLAALNTKVPTDPAKESGKLTTIDSTLTSLLAQLDVALSTRASQATVALILAQLDVALSTRLGETVFTGRWDGGIYGYDGAVARKILTDASGYLLIKGV